MFDVSKQRSMVMMVIDNASGVHPSKSPVYLFFSIQIYYAAWDIVYSVKDSIACVNMLWWVRST